VGLAGYWRLPDEPAASLREYLLRGGFLNDVSDSWQWTDNARYPAESANLGLRLGVNIAVYALTHRDVCGRSALSRRLYATTDVKQ
jgi:hypothetical protein